MNHAPMSMLIPVVTPTRDRDSFRSYVHFDGQQSTTTNTAAVDDGCESTSDESLDRLLDDDEIIASYCNSVILYPAFSDKRTTTIAAHQLFQTNNLFGKIFCTNFRLRFIPLAEKAEDPCCSRSLVLTDHYELALCAIEQILYCSVPVDPRQLDSKRFRPMTSLFSFADIVSCIKICTKDFRICAVDFQNAQNAIAFVNHIWHFSQSTNLRTLYQLARFSPQSCDKYPFNSAADWKDELHRCGANRMATPNWRISLVNVDNRSSYHTVSSYPEFVVVPVDLYDNNLESIAAAWTCNRFPIWCWSAPNGCAILRSSEPTLVSMATEQMWEFIVNSIAHVHPENSRPLMVDVTIAKGKIANAYASLRKLCTIDSITQFLNEDNQYLSSLDDTGWMQLVLQCLEYTTQVIECIYRRRCSIIIKEQDGFDMNAIVSSLAQICMDAGYRTQKGFARLIHKEWCALGHPFGARLIGCASSSAPASPQTTPTLLLFLDCVSQLLVTYPIAFEYSHIMLIAVWDLAITGLTTTFTVNSLRDASERDKYCDAFPLSRFYSSQHCRLFTNSRYGANLLLAANDHTIVDASSTILWPPTSMPLLHLWSHCYHRWMLPAHTVGGGDIVHEIAIAQLSNEIAFLMNETRRLTGAIGRKSSQPAVVWRIDRHPAAESTTLLCSAYPYTKLAEERQKGAGSIVAKPKLAPIIVDDDDSYDGTLV